MVVLASLASLAAIVRAGRWQGGRHRRRRFASALALVTVVGSWLLLPTWTAGLCEPVLHAARANGLEFSRRQDDGPAGLRRRLPLLLVHHRGDVTDLGRERHQRPMRRLVLLQSMLSFVFNTGCWPCRSISLAGI
jgi:uncharacterized membrane protein